MINATLKKLKNRWYIATGPLGFSTTNDQRDVFSRRIKGNSEKITITKDRNEKSFYKIVPKDNCIGYDCDVYDVNDSEEYVTTLFLCYAFFEKFNINGEFYFNRI